jgi:hypothetical protein
VLKINNSTDYKITYTHWDDVRLEADSPGYAYRFTAVDFTWGDLGINA